MNDVRLIAITKPTVSDCESAGDLLAYCARVSNPGNQNNKETAPKLLRYLVNNQHWSPFEMASMTVEINTTRDIARQILRHRSFSFQEFSQRYAVVQDEFVERQARLQDMKNRQNSVVTEDDALQDWWFDIQRQVSHTAQAAYELALKRGLAKEVARTVLPEGLTPSRLYMAGTIRSFIHYVLLRRANGTQAEHREVALQVQQILLDQFPELTEVLAE